MRAAAFLIRQKPKRQRVAAFGKIQYRVYPNSAAPSRSGFCCITFLSIV
jgi:hypothetical protein